jgi:hypothetical protein
VLGFAALIGAAAPVLAAPEPPKIDWHGEVRLRGEYVDNFQDWNSDSLADDGFDFFPYRARVGVGGEFANNVRGYIELQAANAWGTEMAQRHVLDSNDSDIDLYLATIEAKQIGGSNTDLTFGRQELRFDHEFLLGDLDFYNGVSLDGVRATWNFESGPLDAFWFRTNETFEDDADTDFWGAHYTWDDVIKNGDIGVYGYYLRSDTISGTGRQDIFTIGGRAGQERDGDSGFVWNAEVAFQAGTIGNVFAGEDADIAALGFEGWFGYNWHSGENDHTLQGKVYYGSGDDDPTDDEANSFNPLFQDFHDSTNRLGVADVVAGSNVMAISLGYNFAHGPHSVLVEFFDFLTAEAAQDDHLGYVNETQVGFSPFSVPGDFDGVAITPNGNDEDSIGQELDVVYNFDYTDNLSFGAGLGYFMPGQAIEDGTDPDGAGPLAGFDDAAMRLYGQARLRW